MAIRSRPVLLLAFAVAATLALAGCTDNEAAETPPASTAASQPAQTGPVKEGIRPRDSSTPVEAAIETPPAYEIRTWTADGDNVNEAKGRVTIDGIPVVGAIVAVDGYRIPEPTGADGSFTYPVDATVPIRHTATVVDVSNATVDGYRLSPEETQAVEQASGAFETTWSLTGVQAERRPDGTVRITGKVGFADGSPPPPVVLTSYRLTGTIRSADGKPVEGAIVSVRTLDRDFWTFSEPSDADGRYSSDFSASDRLGSDPAPFTVRVSIGDSAVSYLPGEYVLFTRLQSARMDIVLPPDGYAPALPAPVVEPGSMVEGVLVGATSADGESIKPVEARWPAEDGTFELVLPASASGTTVSLWTTTMEVFSRTEPAPGGPIDVDAWPARLGPEVPRDVVQVDLP
jgi:hypothetical protein